MSNARDKANIPALNFSSTGIDDNATSTAITIDSSQNVTISGDTLTVGDSHTIGNDANDNLVIQSSASENIIYDSASHFFQISGTTKAQVKSNGLKVTNSGGGILEIEGSTATSGDTLGVIQAGSSVALGADDPASIKFKSSGSLSGSHKGAIEFFTNDAVNNARRLRVTPSGDIAFYEDTGTTAKMLWDASTERLGIGTSSPLATLHVEDEVADNSEEGSFILSRSKKHSGYVSNVTATTGTIIFQISSTSSNYRSALCKLNLHGRTGAIGGVANHPSAVYYFTLVLGFGATANFSTPTLTAVYENVFDKATDFAFSSTTNNKTCTLTFTNPTSQLQNTMYYTLEIIGERFNLDSVTKT